MKVRPSNLNNVQPTEQDLLKLRLLYYQINNIYYKKNHSSYTRLYDSVFPIYARLARSSVVQRSPELKCATYPDYSSYSSFHGYSRRFGLDTHNYAAENKTAYVRVLDCPDEATERKIRSLDHRIDALQNILDNKDIQLQHLYRMSECLDQQIAVRRGGTE